MHLEANCPIAMYVCMQLKKLLKSQIDTKNLISITFDIRMHVAMHAHNYRQYE